MKKAVTKAATNILTEKKAILRNVLNALDIICLFFGAHGDNVAIEKPGGL